MPEYQAQWIDHYAVFSTLQLRRQATQLPKVQLDRHWAIQRFGTKCFGHSTLCSICTRQHKKILVAHCGTIALNTSSFVGEEKNILSFNFKIGFWVQHEMHTSWLSDYKVRSAQWWLKSKCECQQSNPAVDDHCQWQFASNTTCKLKFNSMLYQTLHWLVHQTKTLVHIDSLGGAQY